MKKIIKFSHSFDVPLQSCYIIFYCYIVVVDSCRCCITLSVVKIEISATTWYSETDMRWHSPVLKYLTLSNIKDASDFLCWPHWSSGRCPRLQTLCPSPWTPQRTNWSQTPRTPSREGWSQTAGWPPGYLLLQILKYLIFVTFPSIPHTCCRLTYSFYIENFSPSFDEYFLVFSVGLTAAFTNKYM